MRSATLRSSPLTSTPKLNITRIGGMNRSRFGCLIALNATPGKRAEVKRLFLYCLLKVAHGLPIALCGIAGGWSVALCCVHDPNTRSFDRHLLVGASDPLVPQDPSTPTCSQAKANLLSLISRVDRGLSASPEDQSRIESAAIQVELLNPEKEPLKSSLLNGKWRLVYTTSASVLGKDRPEWLRPKGSTFQVIDAGKLRAKNIEGPPTFSSVEAELTVENRDTVQVKFTQFNIGGETLRTLEPA